MPENCRVSWLVIIWFVVAAVMTMAGSSLVAGGLSQQSDTVNPKANSGWQPSPLRWRFQAAAENAISQAAQWRAGNGVSKHRQITQLARESDWRSRWRLMQELEILVQAVTETEDELQQVYREAGAQAASAVLAILLADGQLQVSADGGADRANHQLREIVLASAARYYFTGDREDAARARAILLDFAHVMDQWPIAYNRGGVNANWMPADHAASYGQWDSGGIWGAWYSLDLRIALSLLLGYDLVYETLSEQDRETICRGVFAYHVEVLNRYPPNFLNTLPYLMEGLILFGVVTEMPDWVHDAVSRTEDMHYIGFYPDGTWSESTPAYHRQAQNGLRRILRLLNGYSDPDGYVNQVTGERFDNLDLIEKYRAHYRRMNDALNKITLPDGTLMALNDSDPGYRHSAPKDSSSAELLGTAGYAILGSGKGDGQHQLALNFAGTHNHEHKDMLHMHWYAFGKRLFDETRYRPLKNSGSDRAWSSSTAAHNTVVVDGKNQKDRFSGPHRKFTDDDAIRGWVNYERRRTMGGTRHQGDLLLFDSSHDGVQVVEVEGRNAYGSPVGMYRRTLVKVELEDAGAYVVDIFRVSGGEVHDYMLHGALAEPYAAATSLDLDAAGFVLHKYIAVRNTALAESPWVLDYTYEDGSGSRSTFLSPRKSTLYLGQAPAINRLGEATFAAIRSEGPGTVFVVIHEAFTGQSKIADAALIGTPDGVRGRVGVEITLRDGTVDRVLADLSGAESVTRLESGEELRLDGKLAWLRMDAGNLSTAVLWDGTILSVNGRPLVELPLAAIEGEVVEVWRKESGDPADAMVVDQSGFAHQVSPGQVIHVDLGGMVWSYRITNVLERSAEGRTVVEIEHDPGFAIEADGLVKMLFFPGWGTRNPPTFRIPLSGSLE